MADELFADRYRLERRLGVGGMSTVQLAFDTRLERYVAVKLLAEHLAEDAASSRASAARRWPPRGSCTPTSCRSSTSASTRRPTASFIVMEYVEGAVVRRDPARARARSTRATRSTILAQACRGLDYAHRNGVVHRDIKPGNLLRNHEGIVKLADFGIAKAAERLRHHARSAPCSAPPPTWRRSRRAASRPGPPSDLYALGVVAYQLLAGRLPYEAASLTDLARQQEAGPPPSPERRRPRRPARAREAVMTRAAPADPSGRYEGAPEMERRAARRAARHRPGADRRHAARSTRPSATRMLGEHLDATRAQPGTSSRPAPRTRRLEPIDEPPAPPRAGPPRLGAPPPERRRAARKRRNPLRGADRCSSCCSRRRRRRARLPDGPGRRRPRGAAARGRRGNVQDAVDELKGLIEDNTQ